MRRTKEMRFKKKEHNMNTHPILHVMGSLKDYQRDLVQKEVDSLNQLGMVNHSFLGVLDQAENFQQTLQDFEGTTDEARKSISDTLYVNYEDVERLQEFYKTATSRNETVVLFRFATSNYFTAPAEIVEHGKGLLGNDKYTKGQSYIAQQSVFFDFDVIQLTFVTESVKTAIACVSSPIDIVNPITPPPSMPAYVSDWWIYALFICGGLIAFGTICIVIKSEVRK